MKQNKRGILMLTSMILSISLMCGVQTVKAADGDLNDTGGILLNDTDSNGKIDEVQITVNYAVATADAIAHETDEGTTIDKFTVTDTGTNNLVTVNSIAFVSGDGTIAIFKLLLDETNVSEDTSETALDVVYDATDSNLKVTDGSTPVNVAAIISDVVEKDGAQPIILTAVDQYGTSLDDGINIPVGADIIITFSEPMDTTTLDEDGEWSISPDPGVWSTPSWDVSNKILTLEQGVNFNPSAVETVTLNAPFASSGIANESKVLQNTPDAEFVSNPFTFTVAGETDGDEDGEDGEDITPPEGSLPGPATPNINSGVTLYRMPGDPRVYVIKNKKKRWIKTPKEFNAAGYKWDEVQEIAAEILEEYPDAEALVAELLRAIGDYKVYKLENGKKRWIETAGEFNAAGYNWGDIQEVSPETMASYQNVVLSELLRAVGDHKVYKLKGGKKHWIRTIGEFNAAGYNWEDVEEVPAETLDDYPDSE